MDRPIEIRHDGHTRQVPRDKVYFSFGDGRLSYDCRNCQMNCCRRGFGYWLNTEEERLVQLEQRPHARFFTEPGPLPGYEKMHNQPPACFFLTDDGLCGIHVKHGATAKPLTCSLFPFNRFLLADDHLIVGPKAGLCPLEIMPSDERSALSKHDEIFAVMAERGLDRRVVEGRGLLPDVGPLVDLERRIVLLSEEFLVSDTPLLDFIDQQIAMGRTVQEAATTGHDAGARPRRTRPSAACRRGPRCRSEGRREL